MTKKLINKIKKLHIKKGDIVIAHHTLAQQLGEIRNSHTDFNFPVLLTNNPRNIRLISKKVLKETIELMDKEEK